MPTERYARVCRKCGAPPPKPAQPDYGPGVVGASDAETRWFVGPVLAIIIVVIALATAVVGVVRYYHEAGQTSPGTTSSTALSSASAPSPLRSALAAMPNSPLSPISDAELLSPPQPSSSA